MKVKLKVLGTTIDIIEIPDQAPHPMVISDNNYCFILSQDTNEYEAVPHYNNNSGYLFERDSQVVAINKKYEPIILKD